MFCSFAYRTIIKLLSGWRSKRWNYRRLYSQNSIEICVFVCVHEYEWDRISHTLHTTTHRIELKPIAIEPAAVFESVLQVLCHSRRSNGKTNIFSIFNRFTWNGYTRFIRISSGVFIFIVVLQSFVRAATQHRLPQWYTMFRNIWSIKVKLYWDSIQMATAAVAHLHHHTQTLQT